MQKWKTEQEQEIMLVAGLTLGRPRVSWISGSHGLSWHFGATHTDMKETVLIAKLQYLLS